MAAGFMGNKNSEENLGDGESGSVLLALKGCSAMFCCLDSPDMISGESRNISSGVDMATELVLDWLAIGGDVRCLY
ncbi:hypothetical protein GBA52_010328 [Prunus armeniaca]|nr:hypothetical protein GBA52_010328 [Prunus armeniaca]